MRRTDVIRSVVEVDEITCTDIHRPHAEPHAVGIEAIEVNQAFKCALQRRDIVVAYRPCGFGGPYQRRKRTWREEMRRAKEHDAECPGLINQTPCEFVRDLDGFQ